MLHDWLAAAAHKLHSPSAAGPIHVKIDNRWVDVSAWADAHPGGRHVLEWADGFNVTGAFHTIHLFSAAKSKAMLGRMPAADLLARSRPATVLPTIDAVPGHGKPTRMDAFMRVGERVVQAASPAAAAAAVRPWHAVAPASGLAWQPPPSPPSPPPRAPDALRPSAAPTAVGMVGESAFKAELEALLHRRFAKPAEYKATAEHWARIAAAAALVLYCLAGWVRGSLPETLLLPFAQWLLFSPTVHEASHSTLSTAPWVNKAAAFCGLPFIYNPYAARLRLPYDLGEVY